MIEKKKRGRKKGVTFPKDYICPDCGFKTAYEKVLEKHQNNVKENCRKNKTPDILEYGDI